MGLISPNSHRRNLNDSKKQTGLLRALMVALTRCSGSPSAAPSNAGLAGAFGHRLSEFRNKPRSVWLVRASFDGRPAIRVAQDKSGSWGVLFFAFFLMDKHKKEWSPKRRNRISHEITFALCKQRKVTRLEAKKNRPKIYFKIT